MSNDLPRTIGFWGATAVMVGIIIGSGIFKTPPYIAAQIGSPMLILLLWVVGGVLALMGALTFAELVTTYPQSGGLYAVVREAYGRCVAFVFGWSYMLIVKPLAAAGIAVVFAEHLNKVFGTSWNPEGITCVTLVGLTFINARGVQLGTGVAMLLTGAKFLALLAIVALALAIFRGPLDNSSPQPIKDAPVFWLALVPVMQGILWTYDGWADVGSIAGEVKDPQRMLPRIYLAGTAAVIVLYVLVNSIFFWMMPLAEIARHDTVGPVVMEMLIGKSGGWLIALLVVVSTIGSTHSSIMTGARVTFAQARDGLLFAFLGKVHSRFKTPAIALWVQCGLSCAAVLWLQSFEKLASGFVFNMWIWYGLAGAAIFVFRVRQPDAARPYRCWGYPVVPGVFVLSALGMTVMLILEKPWDALPWIGVLLAGVPVYFVWEGIRRKVVAGASVPR